MAKQFSKKYALLLFTMGFLFLSACGKDKEAQEEAELDAVSASVSGTLTSFTGSELSLKTDKGEKLTFDNCSDAAWNWKTALFPATALPLSMWAQ